MLLSIYEVPLRMLKEKLDIQVLNRLGVKTHGEPNLEKWKGFLLYNSIIQYIR